ncbi:MAG: peptide ABC transporter substrate-binding protein, partial [Chlamydiia bacterium]|nr:peptide ABC transporter substrate-binding protein [Chlamydiia bacterium]
MHRFFLSIVLAASIFFSCNSKHKNKNTQTVKLNIRSDPITLDPRCTSDFISNAVIRQCFDGLMRRDQNGRCSFSVAKDVKISNDGLTYLFYLKETVWNDQMPVIAKNFEDAWKSILNPDFSSEISYELFIIKNGKNAKEGKVPLSDVGVKALSDYVLQIDLEHPAPYFLDLLSTTSFYPIPSHIVAKNPNWTKDGGSQHVCNGPFFVRQWKHYSHITLLKNPDYWDKDVVRLDQIEMYMIENENIELSMYYNGVIDWAGTPFSYLPQDAISSLIDHPDFHMENILGIYYYIFNTQTLPFSNKHIRKAFSLAINRKAIIDNLLHGTQRVATSLIPLNMWDRQVRYFGDADIIQARKELAIGLKELGITKKDLPEIKLSYNNTSQAHHKISQAIKDQWSKALNIAVRLENVEWKVLLDHLRKHDFQIARMSWFASFNDPITFLGIYRMDDSEMNQSRWSNANFTSLLNQADVEKDPTTRLRLLGDAEAIFIDEMPVAPIYFYSGSYL